VTIAAQTCLRRSVSQTDIAVSGASGTDRYIDEGIPPASIWAVGTDFFPGKGPRKLSNVLGASWTKSKTELILRDHPVKDPSLTDKFFNS
jgi:hypothetical protein